MALPVLWLGVPLAVPDVMPELFGVAAAPPVAPLVPMPEVPVRPGGDPMGGVGPVFRSQAVKARAAKAINGAASHCRAVVGCQERWPGVGAKEVEMLRMRGSFEGGWRIRSASHCMLKLSSFPVR